MSFSQSDSFTNNQCELISLLPTGLDDRILINLKADPLPSKISTAIQIFLDDLVAEPSKRIEILMQLLNKILSYSPITREEYLWYLKVTATVLLLKDLPLTFCTVQGHLLTNVLSMPTDHWNGSPIKIHYFASGLYDIFENDFNMMFVINQFESKSLLGLYVSMVMLWKSLYRCIDDDKDIFRLYPPSNLLEITIKMNANKLETNFEKFVRFFGLFSKLVNLIFHRKARSDEYICFSEFFLYDMKLVKNLRKFVEHIVNEAEVMWRKDNENLNILTMIEFLQIDLSEFDTLMQNVSN